MSHELTEQLFLKYFGRPDDGFLTDAALLEPEGNLLAFTTDSFVVDPVFFPGGDIGKLAVCGTVNDLCVAGASPAYLTAGFIIEEGFPLSQLETIVKSMALCASEAGVKIIAGDTKVVHKHKCDKIFINTSGIGILERRYAHLSKGTHITPGDKIIINGFLADHGLTVMTAREALSIRYNGTSDCAPLNHLIRCAMDAGDIHFMRDATRGGLAAIVTELVDRKTFGIELHENKIPLRENTKGLCEMLGFDPLQIANEGKVMMVVASSDAEKIVAAMQKHPYGKDSCIIGEITDQHPGTAVLNTIIGGKRIIDMPAGELLPRIC